MGSIIKKSNPEFLRPTRSWQGIGISPTQQHTGWEASTYCIHWHTVLVRPRCLLFFPLVSIFCIQVRKNLGLDMSFMMCAVSSLTEDRHITRGNYGVQTISKVLLTRVTDCWKPEENPLFQYNFCNRKLFWPKSAIKDFIQKLHNGIP